MTIETVETFEVGDLTARIVYDPSPISPREWDNLATMVCFHRRYSLGDDHKFRSPDEVRRHIAATKAIWLPLYLYDHSGITMQTAPFSCPWDSGQVGGIYIEREKLLAELSRKRLTRKGIEYAERVMRHEVETYNDYLTGNVYGFIVENGDGDELDSYWGICGLDHCRDEAKSAAECEMANILATRANEVALYDSIPESISP
jgi:hypothetical protein